MKISAIIATMLLTVSSVSAFGVNTSPVVKVLSTKLNSNTEGEVGDVPPMESKLEIPSVPTLNGWTADASLPCYGLPGEFEICLLHGTRNKYLDGLNISLFI